MITAIHQAHTKERHQKSRRIQLVDSQSDFQFGVNPDMLDPTSEDFECLHDVEFIVRNSRSQAEAVEKLGRFIQLLGKNGFDVPEE